ncbi:MAG: hypothetical protein KDJ47_16995 [Hyphomicrobiaceae bacterium]|nr:hypothetical protein [Hyphomicrobiaceae bacterium]
MLAAILQVAIFIAISSMLFWLVGIYGSALRDPRYLDGWILAVGMLVQLMFHVANRRARLKPSSAVRWRRFHVSLGYLLIAAFILHTDFTLPDTGLEWALWSGFVVIALSGVFGVLLAWSLKARMVLDEHPGYEHIARRRAELARDIHAVVAADNSDAAGSRLPQVPYDAWVRELYARQLDDFFSGPRNYASHLVGSPRPLKRLTDEIDTLSGYVDRPCQDKLQTVRELVVRKDREDFARVHLGLARAWPYLHMPVTYSLLALTVLHVVVVYAFSSGAW